MIFKSAAREQAHYLSLSKKCLDTPLLQDPVLVYVGPRTVARRIQSRAFVILPIFLPISTAPCSVNLGFIATLISSDYPALHPTAKEPEYRGLYSV